MPELPVSSTRDRQANRHRIDFWRWNYAELFQPKVPSIGTLRGIITEE
jgi:hypothetical protein